MTTPIEWRHLDVADQEEFCERTGISPDQIIEAGDTTLIVED